MNVNIMEIIHGKAALGSFLFGALCLTEPLVANAAIDMQEGQWKTVIGIAIEVPSLPLALPSVKFLTSACLTQKDTVPNTAQKNERCVTINYEAAGSTVIWKFRCIDNSSTTEGSGEIIYKDTTYEGVMHMTKTFNDPRMQPVKMRYTLYGNYIGTCER